MLVEESCDKISDEDVSSRSPATIPVPPLFKLEMSSVAVVAGGTVVEGNPEPVPDVVTLAAAVEFESVVDKDDTKDEAVNSEPVAVVVVELISDADDVEVTSLVVVGVTVATAAREDEEEVTDDVTTVDEEASAAAVVVADAVVAGVDVLDAVVIGGDWLALLVLGGATTYEVPSPNRCPQYLLSSISSSKNISFMRKKVCPVNSASEPA